MSVRRKLFAAMGSMIVCITLLIIFISQVILKESIPYMVKADRSQELAVLSETFRTYYADHGVWDGIGILNWQEKLQDARGVHVLLVSPAGERLYMSESADYEALTRLGLKTDIPAGPSKEGIIATLYYSDPLISNIAILRLGVGHSIIFLLTVSAIVLAAVSLAVAYWLSRRFTAPLQVILPVIDRLGKGDFGIQAPVTTTDEYGRVAAAINQMSAQLRRAEEVRRNLVADVAHELRTPLTIVRGELDLLQQQGESVAPEALLPLQDELIRLTRLVDDLHQLSLAEAKKLPLERKPTDLPALLERIADRIRPDATGQEVYLLWSGPSEFPPLMLDSNRITQVFFNLIVNAVRYTPPGGTVHVTAELPADGHQVRVSIRDTGIGIPPEHLPHVFDRFYRVDQARTRDSGGMGLGLAIAKECVLAHGGTIEVESAPGVGTTFRVGLPL